MLEPLTRDARPYVLDNSQYDMYALCPLKWYERYIEGIEIDYGEKLRDDPLCIGGLTHDGLRQWYGGARPRPTDKSIQAYTPSRDALELVYRLLDGYAQAYPRGAEPWTTDALEEPLLADLTEHTALCAKVDALMTLHEDLKIGDGLGGTLHLQAGQWVREFKTRNGASDREAYARHWRCAPQASFQTLVARAHYGDDFRGVLVDVLDKPVDRPPTRKCDKCDAYYQLADWKQIRQVTKTMYLYSCPMCGSERRMKPPEPKPPPEPTYWRCLAERTDARLELDIATYDKVAREMEQIREGAFAEPRFRNCRHQFGRDCAYIDLHAAPEPMPASAGIGGGFRYTDNPTAYIWE